VPTRAFFSLSLPTDERGTVVLHGGPEGDVHLSDRSTQSLIL